MNAQPADIAMPPGATPSDAAAATEDRVKELLRSNEELTRLNARLSEAQDKLMQSEKMASIGQLAAGVAHEINNPIGFIFSNFGTLEIEVTVNDPKAYTRPWTVSFTQRLLPDEELIEFICGENETSTKLFDK